MTSEHPDSLSDEQLADLARLADGTLPEDRRAEVEAQVAASPELQNVLRSQQLTLEALEESATRTGAPARLRADVERRRAPRARTRRVAPRLRGVVVAGTAVVLAAALILPSVLAGPLTVADAAAFADRPPSGPAPERVRDKPQLLKAKVEGVPFPNYAAKFGWKPIGTRHDSAHDRRTTTVYYRKGNRVMAYSIVSGDELEWPSHARKSHRGGEVYRTFQTDGRTVVTWERGGHTCVLSATTVSAAELEKLADWRGKGAIPF
jgi:anti-sigma factor RsiW